MPSNLDLVTGASGLLGGNLVRELVQRGRRVRILVRPRSNTSHLAGLPNLQPVPGDVTHPASLLAALDGVENVYHCAAQVSVRREMTPAIWQANVTGTENILAAARQACVRRVIHCSSVDALGLPENGQPAREDTPWNWDRLGVENAYARSKYESHRRALQAASPALDVVVVCPTFMFGAYDLRPSSGQIILSAARSPFRLGIPGGNNFVDVLDVVEGMLSAAARGRSGQAYILGNANLTYDQVFEMIAGALGKRTLRLPVPYPLGLLAGRLGDGLEKAAHREPGLNSPLVRLAYLGHYYDSSLACRELDLPRRSLPDAVARAVAWFRQAGMLA